MAKLTTKKRKVIVEAYGEAHIKLKMKQKDLPPVTPVTAIVQELAVKERGSAGEEEDRG